MKLYSELADWFHLVTHPSEYAGEAAHLIEVVEALCEGPAETLLELGAGGGNTASHLKARFRCTLTDLAPEMLAQSRSLNPDCEHVLGDMRSVRLGRRFDVVLAHDATSYLTREEDVVALAQTAATHLRSGGVALFCVDDTAETFEPGLDSGGFDDPDGRGARYFSWSHPPAPGEMVYPADYVFLLREADGAVRCVHDRHWIGALPRAQWEGVLRGAGLQALQPDTVDPFADERVLFVAQKPL